MPSVTAQTLIASAGILLQDSEFMRWQKDELLAWLSDGQREYVRLKPGAYVVNADFTLVQGTKQQLPDDGVDLIDVPRNRNGNAIRAIARRSLDSQIRDWTSQSRAKPTVAHYCYSSANAKYFDVYPPSPGGNVVELVYHAVPPPLTLTGALSVDDSAASALLDYAMFRALTKDTEYAANDPRAALHYQAFITAATGKAPQQPPSGA